MEESDRDPDRDLDLLLLDFLFLDSEDWLDFEFPDWDLLSDRLDLLDKLSCDLERELDVLLRFGDLDFDRDKLFLFLIALEITLPLDDSESSEKLGEAGA